MAPKARKAPKTPNPPARPASVPDVGQELEQEELLKECEELLEKLVDHELDESSDFGAYEKKVLEIVHEIARRKLQKKLQTIADGFPARLAIDHTDDWHGWREDTVAAYRRHCPGTVTYHSLVGPLRVRRSTYRLCGGFRSTHVPLDLAAGLMERMTPAFARCVAIGYAHMPLRTFEELLVASEMRPPSRSTVDRAARDLGAYAVACNAAIEPLVRANEVMHPQLRLVAVGLDRVAVPMRHGEVGQGALACQRGLRRSRPKPKRRDLLQGPVQWRMDYVATVAFLDGDKNLLGSRKYRLPGESDIAPIVARVMADVRHALTQRPVEVAVIQDGAPELWTAIAQALRAEPLVPRWTEVLDWYHLDERLTKCLDLCVEDRQREPQRRRWHRELAETEHGARKVIRSLQRKLRHGDPAADEQLESHIGYLERNEHRMEYASYRARGIPIGSGVTEGACKSLVNVRAKRSGQRWSQRGLTAALHLRSICESDRFDGFWSFFTRRYRATHLVPIGLDVPIVH